MGIRFISGKPGGGKSYYATLLVLERLRESKKQIVTNLPLRVGEICALLHKEDGHTHNAAERIRLLDETETSQFWVYFGNGLQLNTEERLKIRMADGRIVPHLNYQPRYDFALAHPDDNSGAVCYFIDEAHEFFNAREWKDLGKDCLHYLSQHRKLGDEVTFITQHVRNVDTQLRRVAAEFCYARNHMKEKLPGVGGLFKSVQKMGIAFYNQEETASAVQVNHRFISPQWDTIGKCYDTAAGVGIGGRQADIGEKAKGLPMWVIWLVLALIGYGIHKLTDGKMWARWLGKGTTPAYAMVNGKVTNQSNHVLSGDVGKAPAVEFQEKQHVVRRVRLTGLALVGGELKGFFTDGTNTFDVWFSEEKTFGGIKRRQGRVSAVVLGGRVWNVGEEKEI